MHYSISALLVHIFVAATTTHAQTTVSKSVSTSLNTVSVGGKGFAALLNGLRDASDGCWRSAKGRGWGSGLAMACPDGWEKGGIHCYKPCPKEWKGVGPVCMKGLRVSRRRRGKGIPRICGRKDEVKSGWFCHKKCPEGYKGRGPLCFQETCPPWLPKRCGPLCVSGTLKCTAQAINIAALGIGTLLASITVNVPGIVGGALGIAANLLAYPPCHKMNDPRTGLTENQLNAIATLLFQKQNGTEMENGNLNVTDAIDIDQYFEDDKEGSDLIDTLALNDMDDHDADDDDDNPWENDAEDHEVEGDDDKETSKSDKNEQKEEVKEVQDASA